MGEGRNFVSTYLFLESSYGQSFGRTLPNNQIFLPVVLRCARFAPESSAINLSTPSREDSRKYS